MSKSGETHPYILTSRTHLFYELEIFEELIIQSTSWEVWLEQKHCSLCSLQGWNHLSYEVDIFIVFFLIIQQSILMDFDVCFPILSHWPDSADQDLNLSAQLNTLGISIRHQAWKKQSYLAFYDSYGVCSRLLMQSQCNDPLCLLRALF